MPDLVTRPERISQIVTSFTNHTEGGLFVAAWQAPLDRSELARLETVWEGVVHPETSVPADNRPLIRLLGVRVHCLRAAAATDPASARTHYLEALRQCADLMMDLHHVESGEEADLAAWALGAHTLIRAQLAMPEAGESRKLALSALDRLSQIQTSRCAGALQDARSAHELAHGPGECAARLHHLPFLVLDRLSQVRYQAEVQVSLLNQRLLHVRGEHSRAFHATLSWVAVNLALLITLPLNGVYYGTVPWSLPFLLALPSLWWWTWALPYREGMRFFDWLAALRHRSLLEFRNAAAALPDYAALFAAESGTLLEQGWGDLVLLDAFYLGATSAHLGREHLQETERIAAHGRTELRAVWMAEMDDSHPTPVSELLPTQPSRVPHATRIYLDAH